MGENSHESTDTANDSTKLAAVAQANELDEALSSYRRAVESFRWELPAAFNFGRAIVDHFAAEPGSTVVHFLGL